VCRQSFLPKPLQIVYPQFDDHNHRVHNAKQAIRAAKMSTAAPLPGPLTSDRINVDLSRLRVSDTGALAWDVAESRIVFEFFEAVQSGSVRAEEASASGVQSKRKRPSSGSGDGDGGSGDESRIREELAAYQQWLRLCRVPSTPAADGQVNELSRDATGANQIYMQSLTSVNNLLGTVSTGRDGLRRVETISQEKIKAALSAANAATGALLQPPPFQTLNAGRLKYESLFVELLQQLQSGDGFTNQQMASGDGVVAHVVPKAWLRTATSLQEFGGAPNDPNNVFLTRSTFNETMSTLALYLGEVAYASEYRRRGSFWAPNEFTLDSRRAMARTVAFVALTYPFVSSEVQAMVGGTGRPNGMPLYFVQRADLLKLIKSEPSKAEYDRAWLSFAFFGWVNPLVTSKETRKRASDSATPLGRLLLARLGGTDELSSVAASAMRAADVEFAMRSLGDQTNPGYALRAGPTGQ